MFNILQFQGKNEIEVDVEVEVNEVYENVKVKNPNKKRKIYFTPQENSKEEADKEEKETLVWLSCGRQLQYCTAPHSMILYCNSICLVILLYAV